MRYKTRTGYYDQIVRLIAQGYDNKQIFDKVGCNMKYPSIVRKQLLEMSEAERERLYKEALKDEKKEKPEEPKKPGLNTPYKAAKGSYIRSGY